MLLLLCGQGAGPNKKPRPMPAGLGEKSCVVEFLAHDSFHGPARAGHVFTVHDAHDVDHEMELSQRSRKVNGYAGVDRIDEASRNPPRRKSRKGRVRRKTA